MRFSIEQLAVDKKKTTTNIYVSLYGSNSTKLRNHNQQFMLNVRKKNIYRYRRYCYARRSATVSPSSTTDTIFQFVHLSAILINNN